MGAYINSVQILGNLGKPAKILEKDGPDGTKKMMALFSLATQENWRDETGAKKDRTRWVDIRAFDWAAKLISETPVGGKVFVQGRLGRRSFMSKGVRKYAMAVDAIFIINCTPKEDVWKEANTPPAEDDLTALPPPEPGEEDEGGEEDAGIPF